MTGRSRSEGQDKYGQFDCDVRAASWPGAAVVADGGGWCDGAGRPGPGGYPRLSSGRLDRPASGREHPQGDERIAAGPQLADHGG